MKVDLFDSSLFSKWLREVKGLSVSSVHNYVKSVEKFLSENPDIENANDYNKFIIQWTRRKNCYSAFYAIQNFIQYKFQDNVGKKVELLDNITLQRPPANEHSKGYDNLTDKQIINVINDIEKEKYQAVAIIQWRTGARVGDVLRTEKNEIKEETKDDGEAYISMNLKTKGEKFRKIAIYEPFTSLIKTILKNLDENDNYPFLYYYKPSKYLRRQFLFEKETDKKAEDFYKQMSSNYKHYWVDLKEALIKNGISPKRFTSHVFRKMYGRAAWNQEKDIIYVQRQMGHADPRTTLRYLKTEGLDRGEADERLAKRPLRLDN